MNNLVALLEGEHVVASCSLAGRGASERFAPALQALLEEAGWRNAPERVVAVVGPGSFTGLRASLALAAGLVRGWKCRAEGVRLGDALRATIKRHEPERDAAVTVLCLARRGRVFIDPPQGDVHALPLEAVKSCLWPAVAGDAVSGEDALTELVGPQGVLVAKDAVEICSYPAPDALGILHAAQQAETQGTLLPLNPLYIDPPEARLPMAGLRPAPV